MSDEAWLDQEPMRRLVIELAEAAAQRYRIGSTDAAQIIRATLTGNDALRRAADEAASDRALKRMRVYKEAAQQARRNIYYQLRTYRRAKHEVSDWLAALRQDPAQTTDAQREAAVLGMLENHASTRERLPLCDAFYRRLFAAVAPPRSLVDIGCGVHPLMFPWDAEWVRELDLYLALDQNPNDIAAVEAFAAHRTTNLVAARWDAADGWPSVERYVPDAGFDVALMLKLIPVLGRQQRDLLPVLARTPASIWLVSGSCVSLTKNRSIQRREQRVLESFVRDSGREVRDEFAVGEEFVWVVAEPADVR